MPVDFCLRPIKGYRESGVPLCKVHRQLFYPMLFASHPRDLSLYHRHMITGIKMSPYSFPVIVKLGRFTALRAG